MKFLISLLLVSAVAYGKVPEEPIDLVLGVSKTLVLAKNFGALHLTNPKIFMYRRLKGVDGQTTKLLLIPQSVGTTDLTLHEPDNVTPRVRYLVRVTDDRSILAAQKEEERMKGWPVQDLAMTVGISHTEDFSSGIGPIYLTDPKLVEFRRMPLEGDAVRLILIPKAPGITDLTVHDTRGEVKKRYFINVTEKK